MFRLTGVAESEPLDFSTCDAYIHMKCYSTSVSSAGPTAPEEIPGPFLFSYGNLCPSLFVYTKMGKRGRASKITLIGITGYRDN